LISLDNVSGKQRSRDSDGSENKKYFRRLSEQDAALCRGHIICLIEAQDGRDSGYIAARFIRYL
jgi:hypothetical protein